jgi:hypothetical protein
MIIDIALKVTNFSILFNLRSGDWDLRTLPFNHLSHDIQKTLYVPLKGNPHSLEAQPSVEHCPGRTYNLFGNTSPRRFTHLKRQGRRNPHQQKLTGGFQTATDSKGSKG